MQSEALALVSFLFSFVRYTLLARVIFSWVQQQPGDPLFPLANAVEQLTEPICAPVRKVIPPLGMFDLSIIFVFIGLSVFEGIVYDLISGGAF